MKELRQRIEAELLMQPNTKEATGWNAGLHKVLALLDEGSQSGWTLTATSGVQEAGNG